MDNHYIHPKLARLYDLDSGWSNEREFYLSLAGDQPKQILDLGCGTGLISNAMAAKGHEVTGVDPAGAMLDVAKTKSHGTKVKWVQSRAQNFKSKKRFDLIIMTGNAFQVFMRDEDLQAVFEMMSIHLNKGGLIAFETRNPAIDWEAQWNYTQELKTPDGAVSESRRFLSWSGKLLSFELRYKFPTEMMVSHSKIRFWSQEEIEKNLKTSDLHVERLMGDWDNKDFDPKSSKEMVFFLRKNS